MGVSLERASDVERRLTISVPSHEIDEKIEAKVQDVAKTAHIRGFRKGRVPVKEIKRRYGASLRQEVVVEAIDKAYQEAVSSESLEPVGQPHIDLTKNEKGHDLEFVAVVEVFPTVVVDQYEGVSIAKKTAEITDADIDQMIVKIQEQKAEWDEASEEDAAIEGDKLTIDFSGSIEGEPFDGGAAEDAAVTIGAKAFIPGFEEQLVGMTKGYEGAIQVTFPDDYQEESLQGKLAEFKITVKKIERQILPEVDEDFIKEFGIESGEMAEFRESVKDNMQREMVKRTETEARDALLEALIEKHPFELPKALIQHQLEQEKQQFSKQLGGQLSSDVLDKIFADNEELNKKAENTVRRALIVNNVVQGLESIDISDDLREQKAASLAAGHDNPDQVKEWYLTNPEFKSSLDQLITEDKAFDLMFSKIDLSVEATSYEDAMK